jgi:hypothetical protein
MATDEWNVVPQRPGRNRYSVKKEAANTGRNALGCNGFYGRVVSGKDCEDDEEKSAGRTERIKRDVLECLHALEDQLCTRSGFAHRLMMAMRLSVSSSLSSCSHQHIDSDQLHMNEIIAYGIGNFSTDRFKSSMLQLACLLLLRRCAAANNLSTNDGNTCNELSFRDEQDRVPIHYYEPCILPIEKEILENEFYVNILDCNDMGKLKSESMQCRYEVSSIQYRLQHHSKCTVFYMPHCPMRLYSNVLWAHWSRFFSSSPPVDDVDGEIHDPVIIFGNSLLAYEERTISSCERMDDTNAVFVAAPFATEIPISVVDNAGKRRGGRGCDTTLDSGVLCHLETAFSDCNVIYVQNVDHPIEWPERPREWFMSIEDDGGELQ